ncbi:hypothetical protein [Streptomyces sp. NPDC096324]|uniref:hypothetical protein n=1 Tax=Streptomyces sp. NPDC096324 TaxID=3366085 RepID=UPI0037FAF3F5
MDAVDVHGTVATATLTLAHGADTFTDIFLLVQADRAVGASATRRIPATTESTDACPRGTITNPTGNDLQSLSSPHVTTLVNTPASPQGSVVRGRTS